MGQGQGQAGGHTTARTASTGASHPQAAAGAQPPAGDSRERLRSSQLGGSRFAQSKMNKHELALKRPQIGDVSCSIWAEQLPGGCMGGSDECRSKSTTSTKPTRDHPGVPAASGDRLQGKRCLPPGSRWLAGRACTNPPFLQISSRFPFSSTISAPLPLLAPGKKTTPTLFSRFPGSSREDAGGCSVHTHTHTHAHTRTLPTSDIHTAAQ